MSSEKLRNIDELRKIAKLSLKEWDYELECIVSSFFEELIESRDAPIFNESEQEDCGSVVLSCRVVFLHAISSFNESYETDQRSHAQLLRSGLQLLIDFFSSDSEIYELLKKDLMESEEIIELEGNIKNSEGSDFWGGPRDYLPSNMPANHVWLPFSSRSSQDSSSKMLIISQKIGDEKGCSTINEHDSVKEEAANLAIIGQEEITKPPNECISEDSQQLSGSSSITISQAPQMENDAWHLVKNRKDRRKIPVRPFQEINHAALGRALMMHSQTTFSRRVLCIDSMERHEIEKLDKTLKECYNYNPEIIDAAVSLCEDLEVKNVADFCAVVELVNVEAHRSRGKEITNKLANIIGAARSSFLAEIRNDITRANDILSRADMVFDSALNAVNLYRKHGAKLAESTHEDPMEYYLTILPKTIFCAENLKAVITRENGIICEQYCTSKDEFGVLLKREESEQPIVATIYINRRFLEKLTLDKKITDTDSVLLNERRIEL